MLSKDYLMLRSALGRVSKHATTPTQRLLVLRARFLPSLIAKPIATSAGDGFRFSLNPSYRAAAARDEPTSGRCEPRAATLQLSELV